MSVISQTLPPQTARANGHAAGLPAWSSTGWVHLSRTTMRIGALIAGDALALLLVAGLVQSLPSGDRWSGAVGGALQQLLPHGAPPATQLVTSVLLCLLMLGAYHGVDHVRDFRRQLAGSALGLALLNWGHFWAAITPMAVVGFGGLTVTVVASLLLERRLLERLIRGLRPTRLGAARALLVAVEQDVREAKKHPALADTRQFIIAGVLDPNLLRRRQGAMELLCEAIRSCRADTMVLSGPLSDQAFSILVDAAVSTGCELVATTRSRGKVGPDLRMVWSHGAPLAVLTHPAVRTSRLALKRLIDLVVSLACLVSLGPLMALIALAIRIEGGGPVIFAQRRVGSGGRAFRCYKFRSMRVDAEELLRRDPALLQGYLGNNFKLPAGKDPRITRVGRFLRTTSLDELPQFWNVVRGDMALVGPRPVVPDELDHYGEEARLLLSVRPGIAGAWAVNGRSRVGYPVRANIELAYVRNWDLSLDLSILARAVPVVLSRRGAD